MKCDQCVMVSINGIACHELGCPNRHARWDTCDQVWIAQRECFECGCMVDMDNGCNCTNDLDTEDQDYDDMAVCCAPNLETGYHRRRAKVELFLSDSRGVYIPRDFAQSVKPECLLNVTADDLAILLEGPDAESYWDVWQDVCNSAVLVSPVDGTRYTVYQDGDCWLIEEGAQWPDDYSTLDDLYIVVDEAQS